MFDVFLNAAYENAKQSLKATLKTEKNQRYLENKMKMKPSFYHSEAVTLGLK